MQTKIIPIIGTGYSKDFFRISVSKQDMSRQPHLVLPSVTDASFAIQMEDGGLSPLGIDRGDYILFSTTTLLKATGQIALIRQDEDYIIREAHWSGDMTILHVPSDGYEPMNLPTENIRIVAVLDNVMKDYEDLSIVYFD